MKINIEGEEHYPVYNITDRDDTAYGSLDVPANTVKRWKRITAEFDAVQAEIEDALHTRGLGSARKAPR